MIPTPTATLAQASLRDQLVSWEWINDRWDQIGEAAIEHVQHTVVAVGVGLVIAVALSALALAWRPAYAPITWVTGFLYTIPSLALFSFLVPIMGLGFATAQVALVSYTLLILVRNIVAGIDGVPKAVIDSADGLGMSRFRRLLSVELPLAVPVIVAGLRIATVTTVGLVGITAIIQLGGLGSLIFEGYSSQYYTKMVVGSALSVALAIALDLLFSRIEIALTPWSRRRAS